MEPRWEFDSIYLYSSDMFNGIAIIYIIHWTKILEEKIIKDIDIVDNTKINDFSIDNTNL